jgi:hypothetical protein
MLVAGSHRTIRAHPRVFYTTLAVVAGVAFAIALWDLTMGGFYFRVLGVRLSSWESYKPFAIGMLAIVAAIAMRDWNVDQARTSWKAVARRGAWIAAALAIVSVTMAVHWGIGAAGGADAYGYVSQAALWAHGHLSAPDPLARLAPLVGPASAPLGYQIAQTPGAIVPTYPAGLPIVMAITMILGGPSAVYFVVPLFGGLVVWLTYLLGVRIADARAGVLAAVLLTFSPIFIFQSLEPMNDVPVTAWWLLAWTLALSSGGGTAFGAGLAVSAAVVIRPNLLPLALVLAAVSAAEAPRLRRATLFSAGMVPGCLAVAALNAFWYGSPLASGYGPLEQYYAWRHAVPNIRHYWTWLIELQSVVIVLAIVAPFVARAKPAAAAMLAFFVVLLGCYLFYLVYDTWPFLRFLLPGIPLLLILASSVIVWTLGRLPLAVRTASFVLIGTLLPIWYLTTADRLHVFDIQRAEHRYVSVGEFVGAALPANAVVLSVIQSGSVRWYGQRPTLRWDMLPPDQLDDTLDGLRKAGYDPYVLLEDWEDDLFRARFATTSVVGNVDWQSAIEYYGPISVRVLHPADRREYFNGRRVLPRAIPYP